MAHPVPYLAILTLVCIILYNIGKIFGIDLPLWRPYGHWLDSICGPIGVTFTFIIIWKPKICRWRELLVSNVFKCCLKLCPSEVFVPKSLIAKILETFLKSCPSEVRVPWGRVPRGLTVLCFDTKFWKYTFLLILPYTILYIKFPFFYFF